MVIAYHYKKIGEVIFIIHHLATVLPFYFVLVSKIYLWWQVMPKLDQNYYANVQWSELKFWLDCRPIRYMTFLCWVKRCIRVLSAFILPLKFTKILFFKKLVWFKHTWQLSPRHLLHNGLSSLFIWGDNSQLIQMSHWLKPQCQYQSHPVYIITYRRYFTK